MTKNEKPDMNVPVIHEYIRDMNRRPYGCMIALPMTIGDTKVISIGISICHELDIHKWDNRKAVSLAWKRANTYRDKAYKIPCYHKDADGIDINILGDLYMFVSRCKAYYKDYLVLYPNIQLF